jgi:putative drug exporter of the RND superfamily
VIAPIPLGEAPAGRFGALGRWVARRPRRVVLAWGLLLAVALPLAPRAPGVLSAGGFSVDDLESARARAMLEQAVGLPASALVIVIQSQTQARAGEPAFETAVGVALAGVPQAAHVTGIMPHTLAPQQVSADGRTVYEVVTLDLTPDQSPQALEPVGAALTDVPGIRTYLAGGPAFYGDIQTVSESDLRRSELISLPLAALALLLVFGSVVAAGVPLVVGGTAVVLSLAIIFVLASLMPMSTFVLNLTTLLGLGLGVDYSLLMSSRFREELRRLGGGRLTDGRVDREAVEEAVAASVASAGRAVFFSGLTVLLGLSGLVFFDFMILRSVGVAGAIVVGLAVASALTLLPAILALLGPRVDALPVRVRPRGVLSRRRGVRLRSVGASAASQDPSGDGAWARLAEWVMDRPVQVFVPTLAILLLVGLPFLHVRFNAPDASILPPHVPSREAYDLLVSEFESGDFAPLVLAIRTTGSATGPANVGLLYDYSRRIAADPRVTRVAGIVDLDPRLTREQYVLLYATPAGVPDRYAATTLAATTRGDLSSFQVYTPFNSNRDEFRALVAELRTPGTALAPPPGVSVLVAGGAAEVSDVVNRIAADFPRSAVFIVVTTYLVLFLLLRSVILPLKALAMNALSIVGSYGALVWIFQDGNLSALLGFQPLGFVETTQPVILFCILFGLSMDYEVFLLSRMKEVYDRTGNNREAVARGLERSGRIVTSAALVVVVVAGSFASAEIVLIKALGLGVAIAVALDATVVRALLVPATMRLLGDWNWWMPRRLGRWLASRLPVVGALVGGATALALRLLVVSMVAILVLAACSPAGRVMGTDPTPPPVRSTPSPAASIVPDPQPVEFPRDEAPHSRLTEWWYYTGHLQAADGSRYGFEYVVFRAERGTFPVSWASHLALTDERGGRFYYDERSEIGPQVNLARTPGIALSVVGGDAITRIAAPAAGTTPWTMAGIDGRDVLTAASSNAGFGLDLKLDAQGRLPVLHDGIGWIDFGPAGSSYYYSRTRMAATGRVTLDGRTFAVEGEAWFDHQWGDFISVGGGGWDWFAVNLDDGTDVTLSLVRAVDGSHPLLYGTLVRPDGTAVHLDRAAFSVEQTAQWTSPRTGAVYPAGWIVRLPAESLEIRLRPTVPDQELDTRATTGVVYWEGSQAVAAARDGKPLGGEAYVELTGYAPAR